MPLEERLHLVHNRLGLEALFQWGIMEHSGTYKLGIIAGGWDQVTTFIPNPLFLSLSLSLPFALFKFSR